MLSSATLSTESLTRIKASLGIGMDEVNGLVQQLRQTKHIPAEQASAQEGGCLVSI